MDFFQRLKIFAIVCVSYYVANYIGNSILYNQLLYTAIMVLVFCYLLLSSLNQKFILFTVTVFVSLTFPKLILNQLKWVELMAPLIFFLLIGNVLINKKEIFSKKALIYFVAIGVIIVWSMINYGRNPVSAGFVGGSIKESGVRGYFTIVVGILTFFSSYLFFKSRELPELLTILLYVCLIVGNLMLLHYFVPAVPLPFMKTMSTYASQTKEFSRLSGVGGMASVGIFSLIVLQHNKKWKNYTILMLINFILLLVMSGGRTTFIGVLLVMFVYVSLIQRKNFLPLLMIIILISGVSVFVSDSITLPGQVERIIDVKGGIEQQDIYRRAAYQNYINIFKENPIFGKGIGWKEVKGKEGKFATAQSMHGGHGSYLSILAIYGIGGFFFLLTMLIAGIYHSYSSFKNRLDFDKDSKLALFSFLNLIMLALVFYSGGNGFNNMKLWYFAGLAAGIAVKNEMKKYES